MQKKESFVLKSFNKLRLGRQDYDTFCQKVSKKSRPELSPPPLHCFKKTFKSFSLKKKKIIFATVIFKFMDGLFYRNKSVFPTDAEKNASKIISNIFADIEKCGYSRQKPFIIGAVEDRMKKLAEENNIELGSSDVYMSSHSLSHSEREHKVSIGKAVPKEEIIAFPITRHNMDMSYDGNAFVFTDGKAKFVIHPNYSIKIDRKRVKKVVFITATQIG